MGFNNVEIANRTELANHIWKLKDNKEIVKISLIVTCAMQFMLVSHPNQRVAEHKGSSSPIGEHFRNEHLLTPNNLNENFKELKKCTNKIDCLVYEVSMYSLTQSVLKF